MCGIAGFFNYKTQRPVNKTRLIDLLASIRYRGPDHLGVYHDGDIAIGNVRLAIQDLSEKGNQPVYNEDKSVVVVYNGEIYNYPELKGRLQKKGHVFYSDTDTEILVHLYEEYGEDMAHELNGMFAFALFDIKERTLLLGRDRTAQKPLYIAKNTQGIFFSSELKSMIPYLDNCSLNPDGVRTFLSMGYALEPQTVLQEVETIEPGVIEIFNYDREGSKSFWKFQSSDPGRICDLRQWHERADDTIKKAVKRHFLSDVPVTLMLSGGIDSSLLALYLAEESKIKKAYTGSFIDDASHDEYGYADRLGRHCGFEIERIVLSNRMLFDNLEPFLDSSSMPQGDNSGLPVYCMAKEISKEFRVVLGGDGGDELFGGYPTHTFPYLAGRFSFIPYLTISCARRLASVISDREKYLSLPFKLQQLSLAWGKDIITAHFSLKDFLPEQIAKDILEPSFFKLDYTARYAQSALKKIYDKDIKWNNAVKRLCFTDFNTFLRSATIPKVERNCMRFGLENRLPYLDNQMLDLSIRTAPLLMVEKGKTKKCLKSLLYKKAYGKININPIKQGFTSPLVMLFKNELRSWKEHWLNFEAPFYKPDLYQSLANWDQRGWDLHRLEWNICVLNDWCYRNKLI